MKRFKALQWCMDGCTSAQILDLGLYLVSFAKSLSDSGPGENLSTHKLATAIMNCAGGERSTIPTPFRGALGDLDDFMNDEIPLSES